MRQDELQVGALEHVGSVLRRLIDTQPEDALPSARFRAMLVLGESGLELLGGHVLLSAEADTAAEVRHDYGHVALVEDVVPSATDAITKVEEILNGHGAIGGIAIAHPRLPEIVGPFRRSARQFNSFTFGPEWSLEMPLVDVRQAHRMNTIAAKGERAYVSAAHAYSDWVERRQRGWGEGGGLSPTFRIVVPDVRGRIASADWHTGKVRVALDVRVPNTQLQFLFQTPSGTKQASVDNVVRRRTQVAPNETRAVRVILVATDGEVLDEVDLTQAHRHQDAKPAPTTIESIAGSELMRGENQRVEFKPFFKPHDDKQLELIECVIAFANTDGGRVYVGADDHGVLEGEARLRKLLKAPREEALDTLTSHIKKLISNAVEPVPSHEVTPIELSGSPVVVVSIEKHGTLVQSQTGHVWVRRGGSTMHPNREEIVRLGGEPGDARPERLFEPGSF